MNELPSQTPLRKQKRLPFFIPMMKKILPFGFINGLGVGWRCMIRMWEMDGSAAIAYSGPMSINSAN